jgi:hypothetical protein
VVLYGGEGQATGVNAAGVAVGILRPFPYQAVQWKKRSPAPLPTTCRHCSMQRAPDGRSSAWAAIDGAGRIAGQATSPGFAGARAVRLDPVGSD